ncbi:NAD-dependent epimerase/dehydratase family protein [Sphingomonas sp. LY29]|uniref:NAD-dependent epimerase/dehydratase family protein n=1 Tax=Sphingomonas sp. LY29 TaxID=3095341 RepID=UPI002D79D271|nr:NAD-dependent epimerase/dehydratase family protein [Sphingomonas sp. LY29]WRP25313.1 NAD-dependent epimerase/dehydratase family protein [Sphingomonas sp. LY29]
MKILVTGGAGFIGSHVCDALIANGHDLVVLDNFSLGRETNVEHLADNPNFRLVRGDATNRALLAEIFADGAFECVFHLAANSDIARSHAAPSVDLDNTFMTTFCLLEAMREAGTKQIVFASTSAIYGEAAGEVGEDHGPLAPISHYGAAKLASEAFISSYGENYGIQSWITRFPNVVGPRGTHGAVFDFVQKLRRTPGELEVLGDGTQEKPYLNVHDLVAAILMVWRETSERMNIFNVGAPTRSTVADIARIVIEEGPGDADIRYTGGNRGWVGDVPKFAYDISKISALGWAPTMTSDEAIRVAARAIWDEAQ